MNRTTRRLFALNLALAGILNLWQPFTVEAQTQRQFGRITCEANASGGVPADAIIEREVTNSATWVNLTTPPLTFTGSPSRTTPFIDLTRVTGTSYRYRCVARNAAGNAPGTAVPPGGQVFLDINVPGAPNTILEIITQ